MSKNHSYKGTSVRIATIKNLIQDTKKQKWHLSLISCYWDMIIWDNLSPCLSLVSLLLPSPVPGTLGRPVRFACALRAFRIQTCALYAGTQVYDGRGGEPIVCSILRREWEKKRRNEREGGRVEEREGELKEGREKQREKEREGEE